jgi:hypothetical protein
VCAVCRHAVCREVVNVYVCVFDWEKKRPCGVCRRGSAGMLAAEVHVRKLLCFFRVSVKKKGR